MDKKLNPLQMVARELAFHIDMEVEEVEGRLVDLITFLHDQAASEIASDPDSGLAVDAAKRYRVACEVIAVFGTQLIAIEDIESELTKESN